MGLVNPFSARLFPKRAKNSKKKNEISDVAKPACQVDSDSKFNVDYDALVYFAQKRREMP